MPDYEERCPDEFYPVHFHENPGTNEAIVEAEAALRHVHVSRLDKVIKAIGVISHALAPTSESPYSIMVWGLTPVAVCLDQCDTADQNVADEYQ